jgi:hypothetical protein
MRNSSILYSFENRILLISFLENAEISRYDLEEIYGYANAMSQGKRYGVLFEAFGHYTVNEDALEYMAHNPNNKNVIAKAYVIDSKEAKTKTSLHLIFDRPELKPFTFPDKESALQSLHRAVMQD